MNEAMQRGMGGVTRGGGSYACCPKCTIPVVQIRAGYSVAQSGTPGAVERVAPCQKCGDIVHVFVVPA